MQEDWLNMNGKSRWILISVVGSALICSGMGVAQAMSDMSACLARALEGAADEVTVGALRAECRARLSADEGAARGVSPSDAGSERQESAITRRLQYERQDVENPFALLPHRPNYLILGYNTKSPNIEPFEEAYPDEDLEADNLETKFQISIKVPIVYNLFGDNGDLYLAYTNRSFWQQFNKDISSPFRESDHEPEAWITFKNDWQILGLRNSLNSVGISHQSNGQAGSLSRSWNRIYAHLVFEHEDLYFAIKPWWRIPESGDDDDNPDITDYMGNFEFQGVYKIRQHTLGLMFRNNLEFGDESNRGAVQLDWSFPISGKLRGYLQWFNGYGESLIDYDAYVNSIGVGVAISDWL